MKKINFCIDCPDDSIRELNGHNFPKRCHSCSNKVTSKGNQRVLGHHWKIKDVRKWYGNKHGQGSRSVEIRKNISEGKKNKSRSDKVKKNISNGCKKYIKNNPQVIEKRLKNGFGTKCYSEDGLFFPSIQERNCYYWLIKKWKSVIHNFLGRFDFLINNKIVLEYHPKNFIDVRSHREYYEDRRKLLDKLGYKDLQLIVMVNLSNEEKVKIEKELQEEILKN